MYFRVIAKPYGWTEIESPYFLSYFIEITRMLSLQDVIIIRSVFFSYFFKLSAGKGLQKYYIKYQSNIITRDCITAENVVTR